MTIALPISLAFLDNAFLSGPILSIIVSIAVFISSAISINNNEVIIIIRDKIGTSKKNCKISAQTQSNISCLNADSDFTVATRPSNEYLNA